MYDRYFQATAGCY